MKRLFLITFALSLNITVSACTDVDSNTEQNNKKVQTSSIKPMSEKATLSAAANKTDDGRAVVSGETNLPDDTELLISLSSDTTGFRAQDKSIVSNQKFSAGPFGPESGLSAGNYIVDVIMPIASVQPENVQSIVGNNGQHLTGPLVKDSSWGGKTVEYSFPYTFGSNASIQQAESDQVQLVSDVRSSIEQLLYNGREMEQYRNTNDLAALKICGERMRKYQEKAKTTRTKADTLPMKYMELKVASVDIYSCVSCSNSAIQSCGRVAESLNIAD